MSIAATDDQEEEQKMFYLPRLLDSWPWPKAVNPFYKEVEAETHAWFYSFNLLNEKSLRAFDMCKCVLLAAATYPLASREHLRTSSDLMCLFFIVEEYTDVESADGVREIVEAVIDALKDPEKPRPKGEIILGELARQFWHRGKKTATQSGGEYLTDTLINYLYTCIDQAADRDSDQYLPVEQYLITRRKNSGALPTLAPLLLGLNLTSEVLSHPVIDELINHVCDLTILANDMASYVKERASGDDRYNAITTTMHHFNYNLETAVEWVVKRHEEIRHQFFDDLKRIPSWGADVDQEVREFIYGLANSVRANEYWQFESGRYFGKRGSEFEKTRLVPLLPRSTHKSVPEGKRENVIIPMYFDD